MYSQSLVTLSPLKLKCILFLRGMELWTDKQTDNPIHRCPWQTFQARGITRIEPVGKPYREVCLKTKCWSLKVHQPNSWSKRPGTWIGHVLAYCLVGKKYVGCIELLFTLYCAICRFYHWPHFLLTVHFHRVSPCDLDLCTHKCIQLFYKLLSINWPIWDWSDKKWQRNRRPQIVGKK